MNTPTDNLEARLAEELEERTEFCDWLSVCTSCCAPKNPCDTGPGGSTTCSSIGSTHP